MGCGAIGCEMLKNYALLGIGQKDRGCVSILKIDHKILIAWQKLHQNSDLIVLIDLKSLSVKLTNSISPYSHCGDLLQVFSVQCPVGVNSLTESNNDF